MHILYATDGTEGARSAALLLRDLPLPPGTRVTAATVVPSGDDAAADTALTNSLAALDGCAAPVTTTVYYGDAADAILRAAEDERADLIVMGSRGKGAIARFFLGSVAEKAARHGHCPVLVVRPGHEHIRRVLLGVDGSECAQAAVRYLAELPLPEDCAVQVATALPPFDVSCITPVTAFERSQLTVSQLHEQAREAALERLERVTDELKAAHKKAGSELREGDPAEGLLRIAADEKADLIVVGSHGMGRIERFLLGSVSEEVLRHAHCSVLVVRRVMERGRPRPHAGVMERGRPRPHADAG